MFDAIRAAQFAVRSPAVFLLILCACEGSAGPIVDAQVEVEDFGASYDLGIDGSTFGDAGPPDMGPIPCAVDGDTRTAACGDCGTGQEVCVDGFWESSGLCLNQGECAAGAIETESSERCGQRARICSDVCLWLPWDDVVEDVECAPGELRDTSDCPSPGEMRQDVCSTECTWTPGDCESPCGVLRSPGLNSEVCVPSGSFQRGDPEDGPVASVNLSTFAIDQYPVTVGRYRDCVADGACTLPRWENSVFQSGGNREWYESARDTQVALVAHPYAKAFCEWDGGRRLPTDAEWQKAVRGPTPENDRTLFGAGWDCSAYPVMGCASPAVPSCADGDVGTGTPPSYFGLEDTATVGQWAHDEFFEDYYSTPESQSLDPQGPAIRMSNNFVVHGVCALPARTGVREVRDHGAHGVGFRCARTIVGGI